MYPRYHRQILEEALCPRMSDRALAVIVRANFNQDLPANQSGHPEFHCDDSAIDLTEAYIRDQREHCLLALQEDKVETAWWCFGRLTHSAQDFYAHTTYIRMWVERFGADGRLPEEHEILLPDLRNDPALISGRFYAPWEMITFIPWLGRKLGRMFPKDSHAYLNNDSPDASPVFAQVFRAAVLRTVFEYNQIIAKCSSPELVTLFNQGTRSA